VAKTGLRRDTPCPVKRHSSLLKFPCKSAEVYVKDCTVLAIPQFSSKQFSSKQEDIHHKKHKGKKEYRRKNPGDRRRKTEDGIKLFRIHSDF
jgi:hypothetical protein